MRGSVGGGAGLEVGGGRGLVGRGGVGLDFVWWCRRLGGRGVGRVGGWEVVAVAGEMRVLSVMLKVSRMLLL